MKIVAIGGGEIGRPGTRVETLSIDRETVRLTGKKHPKLLFLPTASGDSESYYSVVRRYFGQRLGCRTSALYLIKNPPSSRTIQRVIARSDMVYVGGFNTLRMMKVWRACGVDRALRTAAERGTVMTGLSAGSICWFRWGSSDYRKVKDPHQGYALVHGLGFLPGGHCPHFDSEPDRQHDLKAMTAKNPGIAVAVDDRAALEVVGNRYRIVTAQRSANAYRVFWRRGRYHRFMLPKDNRWRSVSNLFDQRVPSEGLGK